MMGSEASEGMPKTGGRRWQEPTCIPLAFRGGVREPRLPSRTPKRHEPRDQGVEVTTDQTSHSGDTHNPGLVYTRPHMNSVPLGSHPYTLSAHPPPAHSARGRSVQACSRLFSSARPWARASCFWRWRCRRPWVIAFAADRTPLSGGQVAEPLRRGAQRRRPCPASGGDQHAALDELGDEAERVALHSAVLGFLVLWGERGHRARRLRCPSSWSQMALPAAFRVNSSSSLSPLPAPGARW